MTPQQKDAWFTLACFALATVAYVLAVPLLAWGFNKSFAEAAVPAMGIFGICGFAGLSPIFYRKRNGRPPVIDERDKRIGRQAALGAWGIFWVCFIGFFMTWWGWLQYHHVQTVTVSIHLLPDIVLGAGFIFFLTRAVLIIIQYRRQAPFDG